MDQSLTDQPTPQPKKRRMTFAEWQKANPNHAILPESDKAIVELREGLMELFAQWYRNNQAEARRKDRRAKAQREQIAAPSKRSARSRKIKRR